MHNISEWQGCLTLCGTFVEIWEFYPRKENEVVFIFSPQAVLAGIILSNVLPYLETIYNLPNLWRQNQYDCVSVDVLGGVGRTEGKPAERGREQTKEINQKALADA